MTCVILLDLALCVGGPDIFCDGREESDDDDDDGDGVNR